MGTCFILLRHRRPTTGVFTLFTRTGISHFPLQNIFCTYHKVREFSNQKMFYPANIYLVCSAKHLGW